MGRNESVTTIPKKNISPNKHQQLQRTIYNFKKKTKQEIESFVCVNYPQQLALQHPIRQLFVDLSVVMKGSPF